MAEIAFFVALHAMNGLSVSAPTRLFFLGIRHVFCGLHSTIRSGKCARKLSKIVEFARTLIIIMARNILCVGVTSEVISVGVSRRAPHRLNSTGIIRS
jgi:hypothetical protein